MPDECRTELGYFHKNFKTRISATSWRNTLTRANPEPLQRKGLISYEYNTNRHRSGIPGG